MRRYERPSRRPSSFSSPWPRMMSMVLMLVVLFMLIKWAREPGTWLWLTEDRDEGPGAPVALVQPGGKAPSPAKPAAEQPAAPQESSSQPPAAPLVATGPTDEDADEIEYMKEAFQAVTDSTMENTSVEMAAYQRLVQWSLNQPYELMSRRARRNVLYTQLLNSPDQYRGKLIRINLKVVRILPWDLKVYDPEAPPQKDPKPSQIIPVYEAWGTTPDSGAHPYNVILVDLPPGTRTGDGLDMRVRFVGYFFKVQKYLDGAHRTNRAPVLIGRLEWQPTTPLAFGQTDWYITYGFGAAVIAIVVVALGFTLFGRRRRKPGMAISGSRTAAMGVEEWIDQAESEAAGPEAPADSADDIDIGKPSRNGQDSGKGKGFPHGLDVDHPPGE